MRRADREITDFNKMLELLDEEEVLRLALTDSEGTYIVPVNYGYENCDGKVSFYIHGAGEGRKAVILKAAVSDCREIPFEIDGRHCAEESDSCDASYYYMSVMGTVTVEILDGDERVKALNKLMNHIMPAEEYHFQETVVCRTMVCRLTVKEWTCKEHSK